MTRCLIFAALLLAAPALAELPAGLHCWPGPGAETWQSCWWDTAPPIELRVTSYADIPPTAVWAAGSGVCQNVVSYALIKHVGSAEVGAITLRRNIVVHCFGQPVSDQLLGSGLP